MLVVDDNDVRLLQLADFSSRGFRQSQTSVDKPPEKMEWEFRTRAVFSFPDVAIFILKFFRFLSIPLNSYFFYWITYFL